MKERAKIVIVTLGNLLIEFCRNNNMIICNGRVGKDKGVGEFTCKNSSVVGYCIVSPNGPTIINSFSILEPSKLFSDVHSSVAYFKMLHSNNGGRDSIEIHEEKK